jgi:uncharacterized membrane protein
MLRHALTASLVLAAPAALAIDLSPGPQAHAGATREAIDAVLRWISTGIEVTGVGIIVVGAIGATLVFLYGGLVSVGWPAAFRHYRANLGRGILLGLELLVAADIIGTVAVTPSIENLTILGLIVLIRTFLSVSLGVEIEGHWPWRRSEVERSHDQPHRTTEQF